MPPAEPSRRTRPDFTPFIIEPREVATGLRQLQVGLGLPEVGFISIVLFPTDLPAGEQGLGSLVFFFEATLVGLDLLHVAFGPVELGLVLAGVDREQKIAFLDHVAILEVDLGHVARNARSHRDRDDRLGLTGELLVVGDRT